MVFVFAVAICMFKSQSVVSDDGLIVCCMFPCLWLMVLAALYMSPLFVWSVREAWCIVSGA